MPGWKLFIQPIAPWNLFSPRRDQSVVELGVGGFVSRRPICMEKSQNQFMRPDEALGAGEFPDLDPAHASEGRIRQLLEAKRVKLGAPMQLP